MSWKARRSMSLHVKLRYILKAVSAAAWVIVLPVTYSWQNHTGFAQTIRNCFGNSPSSPSLFIVAVLVYLSPNMLSALLFLFPFIRGHLERSNYKIVMLIMWWSQPRLYVGRGMHESTFSRFKYTMFWVLLIVAKLAFSYYVEISALVGPTKDIMRVHITTYQWHEFFPRAKSNIDVVIAIWAPVVLVYFMDIQIWYAIFSTIFGGIYGAFCHLGEIRTLGMLRSRFSSLPGAFNACLIPPENNEKRKRGLKATLSRRFDEGPSDQEKALARFAQLWNKIITSFREEDLINNREKNLMLVPYSADRDLNLIQWPPFLLASKLPLALDLAKDSNKEDHELQERLQADNYMLCAVKECYASCKNIIKFLVLGRREQAVINDIFSKVEIHMQQGDLICELNMCALPSLYEQFVQLIEYLRENKKEDKDKVVIVLLNMLEVVTRDIMDDPSPSLLDSSHGGSYGMHEGMIPLYKQYQFFQKLRFPVKEGIEAFNEKIKRLHLLLTVKESAMDVPSNLEARRRLSFFSNSLFMDMPAAPKFRNMLSFSVLTPYFNEDVLFSMNHLEKQNEDGVSILFYLQKNYPDEWTNFLERIECRSEEEIKGNPELEEKLRLWASYRGQTLTRTVRGMMYYQQAFELQAFFDMAKDEELMKGYKAAASNTEELLRDDRSLLAQCQAVADLKFTYVVSCQQYGIQKRSGDARAQDILRLMTMYPSLRVAYVDEVEETSKDKTKKTVEKVYSSVLVKAVPKSVDSSEPGQSLDQVIYRIKLPGPALLGEGKPENQNHAIIFTRGKGLQTIDMNQDNYMEEAFKMRNLLQEFLPKQGAKNPTILGLREHIFTGSVSSPAWFMSIQENSFVTIGQRLLANPLKVRFHYGHPDVFDRLFHLTRGGVSKASKTINLSEDIFAGFNSTLRGGNVTHHEYIQVGKGKDVGLNQISIFEAKIANGNGEQAMSRDIYRLGHWFDFFRMLSCYFTTVGFYFSTWLSVLTIYVFLYGRLYLVLSGLEEGLSMLPAIWDNKALQVALASQSIVQIGFLMALPMMMEIGLEKGFQNALSDFVLMQLQLASVFFTFSLGTKAHYYGRTLLHGAAQYRGTGRGFVVFHTKFAENYRLYSRSHFVKGYELMILLLVYEIFGQSYRSAVPYVRITISMLFVVGTWLFAPSFFNPSGFEWQTIVDDWTDWNKWINNCGGIGVPPEKSWESWWEKEQEHLRNSGMRGIIAEILLAMRFFIYQYGLVYRLSLTKKTQNVLVYGISWVVILVILFVMKAVSVARRKFSADFRLVFRLIKGLVFVTFVASVILLIVLNHVTFRDIVVCILAFLPTGWGLLLIAQALKPVVKHTGIWSSVRTLARGYEIIMGLLLFTPVAFLAWFPFVSVFQTRMLYNQEFSRGLQISRILGGRSKDRSSKKKEAMEDEDNNSNETSVPLDDASTRGSKVDSELVMDYSNEFATHEIFKSRDELIRWARQVGRKNGFVIVVEKSDGGGIRGRKSRLSLACERSGSYRGTRKNSRPKTKKATLTGTRKCECPFLLKGKKLATNDDWILIVVCGVHNHLATEYLGGHSYAGRLSHEETSLLVDMSKSMVRPSEILVTVKQRDNANASTMKTIYNARHRYKVVEKAGRSQMQQLLGQLAMNKYIEWHRSCADTGTVTDLFFAHPTSLNLLRAFPKVLLMDCTYKTNRYRLPLLEIVGVTSTDMTFSVAFAYLQYEKEDNYTWALGLLRSVMDENTLPSVIVTNRELALMNAICTVFPTTTNLLCRWHIGKNVLANCKKMFETKDKWEMFIMSWNMLVMSSSEEVYMQRLLLLHSEFSTYQDALHYVTSSWLDTYKSKFVAAWTDTFMHFGNSTTNRVESSHPKLKRYLGSSQGNFESNWTRIHNLLELQHSEIKSSFEKSKLVVQHDFKPTQFKELRGNVSITALEIILAESKRASSVGIDITTCGCVVRRTHGLPCAHEIANYMRENRPIPLSSVCSYWTKLDMLSTPHTVSEEWTCTPELELFAKRFEEVDPDMKRFLLQKLRELAKPDCTFLIEPEVKSNPQGRPKLKIETSTRREPSAFEIVASAQDSYPPGVIAKASVTTKNVKTKKKEKVHLLQSLNPNRFLEAFPPELRRYIKHVKDVPADGNCGFRAIAGLMGFGEEGWLQVRKDLLEELHAHSDHYRKLFGSQESIDDLTNILAYFEPNPGLDRWMTMPDMGHLISSFYEVVLVHLSMQQCLTFLPLRSIPASVASRKEICIGFVNNHFIQLILEPGHPIPPIATNWRKYHDPCAVGWEVAYSSRVQHFKSIINPDVATIETVDLDED